MAEEHPVADELVQEPTIMLVEGEAGIVLSSQETRQVMSAFPDVRRAATKWTLSLQGDGQMLVIDPDLIAAIRQLLAETQAPSADEVG